MRRLFEFFHLENGELVSGTISLDTDWITVVHSEHRESFYQDDHINAKCVIGVEVPGEPESFNYCVSGTVEELHNLLLQDQYKPVYVQNTTQPDKIIRLYLS